MALKNKLTKSTLIVFIAVLLLSSFSYVSFVNAIPEFNSEVSIQSPFNGTIFATNNVTVNFSLTDIFANQGYDAGYYIGTGVSCYLDGKLYSNPQIALNRSVLVAHGEVNLTDLSQGKHTVEINMTALYLSSVGGPAGISGNAVVEFTVAVPQSTNQIATVIIAVVIIVGIALLFIYRKQNLKRKNKQISLKGV